MNPPHRCHPRRAPWLKRVRHFVTGTAVAAVFAVPFLAPGEMLMFLKLGDSNLSKILIEGEVVHKGHEKEIEIIAGSWNTTNTRSGHWRDADSLNADIRTVFNDIGLVKITDKATVPLFEHLATGKVIPKGRLVFLAATGADGAQRPLATMEFEDVVVTRQQMAGWVNEEQVYEDLGLHFKKFKSEIHLYDKAGNPVGDKAATKKGDKAAGDAFVYFDIVGNTVIGNSTGAADKGSFGAQEPTTPEPTNAPPTVSAIASVTIPEDGETILSFTVDDPDTDVSQITVSRGTGNPAVLPLPGIVVAGGGANRTVTLYPGTDATGSATVTLGVSDGQGGTATTSFDVIVTPVNDPPAIGPVPPQFSLEATPVEVPLTVTDVDHPPGTSVLEVTPDNPAILPSAIYDGTTLLLEPSGIPGTTRVTLTAIDPDEAVSEPVFFDFTVAANPIADVEIFASGIPSSDPLPLGEGLPPSTLAAVFQVRIDGVPTPGFTFSLLDDAGGKVALDPTAPGHLLTGPTLTTDFETVPPFPFIVQATNPDGTWTEQFTVEIRNTNEQPEIDVPHFGATTAGASLPLTGITLSDPDAPQGAVRFTATCAAGTLSLDESGPLAGRLDPNHDSTIIAFAPLADLSAVIGAGGLVFNAPENFDGPVSITLSLNDEGQSGSGGPLSATVESFVDVATPPQDAYRNEHFSAAQLDDPSVSDLRTGKGDTDALDNLVEYGVGTDPTDPDSGVDVFEFIDVEIDGETFPAIRFPLRNNDPDLTVIVEVAPDLGQWRYGAGYTALVALDPIDENFDRITIRSVVPKSTGQHQQLRAAFSLPDDPGPF